MTGPVSSADSADAEKTRCDIVGTAEPSGKSGPQRGEFSVIERPSLPSPFLCGDDGCTEAGMQKYGNAGKQSMVPRHS